MSKRDATYPLPCTVDKMPADGGQSATYVPTGYQMIKDIEISNFKCFEQMKIPGCRRINVIVGDNGSGKTALLEAIFFALASTPQIGLRLRQLRGMEGQFVGSAARVIEAVWRDYFYNGDWDRAINIQLTGNGPENRSVRVFRGPHESSLPLNAPVDVAESSGAQISLVWRDAGGAVHPGYSRMASGQLKFEGGEEDLPDFLFFYSNVTIGSAENAQRFSDLSKSKRVLEFIKSFSDEYEQIESLNIELVAGAAVIYATLKDGRKSALPYVSGGINRIIAILLGLTSRTRPVLLIDEIENGIYYKHHEAMWRSLLRFSRSNDGQLFISTHNDEWLKSLVSAAGEKVDDIALWRMERDKNNRPVVRQFNGKQVIAGIRAGGVR